jgi:hypothetical protein
MKGCDDVEHFRILNDLVDTIMELFRERPHATKFNASPLQQI